MRHFFKFDGMQSVDPGYLVQPQISKINPLHTTTIQKAIEMHWQLLRNEAFTLVVERHLEAFPYESANEVLSNFLWLCGPEAEVLARDDAGWRRGDVTRSELLLDNPAVTTCTKLVDVINACLTEMLRNIIRRLHAHEAPLVLFAFQVFQQATQPTQLPTPLLVKSAKKLSISPSEILQVVKERPEFWKAELLDIATSYISSMPGDPEAKSMQVASVYQRIKALYEDESEMEIEVETDEQEKPKKPRTLKRSKKNWRA